MNCYYDRNDFMAGHVISEYYKYCQSHTCVRRKKNKVLVKPDQLRRAS